MGVWARVGAGARAGAMTAALSAMAAPPAAAQTKMTDAPCAALDAAVAGLPHDEAERRRHELDWPALCRYAAENRGAPRGAIVFFGDSITEGWKAAHPAFFPARVLDRGISGQTSAQMVVRFSADVVALHPRVVHIIAGSNDIAGNTGPTSLAAYQDNMRAMADLARANGIRVVIGALPPADRFWWATGLRPAAQIRAVNAWLRGFARERGLRFVDYHAAMTTPAGAMRSDLSDDGVHPNARGYAVMEPLATAALRQ